MIGKNLDLDASEKLGYNNINSCDINIRQYIQGERRRQGGGGGMEMGRGREKKRGGERREKELDQGTLYVLKCQKESISILFYVTSQLLFFLMEKLRCPTPELNIEVSFNLCKFQTKTGLSLIPTKFL